MLSHEMINYFEYCYNTDPITTDYITGQWISIS